MGRSRLFACVVASLVTTVSFAVVPPEDSPLRRLEFRHPDLDYRNIYRPLAELPVDQSQRLGAELSRLGVEPSNAYYDRLTGRWGTLVVTQPLIPGPGVGNSLQWSDLGFQSPPTGGALGEAAAQAFIGYLTRHAAELRIDPAELATPRVRVLGERVIQLHVGRQIDGIPVRGAFVSATINSGNLVLMGAREWGEVALETQPSITPVAAEASLAEHLEGIVPTGFRKEARLEIVPMASLGLSLREPEGGLDHRLAWVLPPTFAGDPVAAWEALVDAHSGELLAFQDTAHYASRRVEGWVYPVSNDGQGPDGTLQPGFPLPFADLALDGEPVGFSTTGGNSPSGGAEGVLSTALSGRYLTMNDNCGVIDESVASGDLDLEGVDGTDCDVPPGHSPGDTNSTRSGYYEMNRIQEQARGYLPDNGWLNGTLTANMNIDSSCNAGWNGSVNFFTSGFDEISFCSNTGELAGVFDHEWGHGMDNNDATGSISNPGEGIADIYAQNRLNTSCMGRNFRPDIQCHGYGDPCLDCTGVRDTDWANRASGQPHDIAWIDANCGSGSSTPCGGSTHCEGAVYAEALWDLVHRDFMGFDGSPWNLDLNTALELGTRLTYFGSSNVGNWFQCVTGGTGGCNGDGGYLNYLAVDDDNGNLEDGTPHMSAIFAAFDRHDIACPTPAVVDSGCAGGPSEAPANVVATPINEGTQLTWDAVAGASEYWVYRTEGVHGCDFGKALVGTTSSTDFTELGLRNDFEVLYSVVAVGDNDACTSPMSACTAVSPVEGPGIGFDPSPPVWDGQTGDGDVFFDNCETGTLSFSVVNTGVGDLTDVRIVEASIPSHPEAEILTSLPSIIVGTLPEGDSATAELLVLGGGFAFNDTLELEVTVTSDELDPLTFTHTYELTPLESDLEFNPSLQFSFEDGDDGWQLINGIFDRTDDPPGGANGTAFYRASSTGLNLQCDHIRSPLVQLSPTSTLELFNQFDIEDFSGGFWWDRANVGVFDPDTGERMVVSPDTGRPYNADDTNPAPAPCPSADLPGWAGPGPDWVASGWSPDALGSPDLAGELVQLDVAYGTDPAALGTIGFWFDEVTLTDVFVQVPDAQSDECDGEAPVLSFDPSSLDFGDVDVGTTSPPQTATLSNTGDADATEVTFSGLPDAGFEADTSACGDILPAGGSCPVSVTFTPGAPGPATANLHVDSTEGAMADLGLSGNGVGGGPIAEIVCDPLNFEVPQGGSDSAMCTISNLGDADLTWNINEAESDLAPVTVPEGAPYRYGLAEMPEFHAPVGSSRASGISRSRGEAPADRRVLPAPQAQAVDSFTEGFDDITQLPGAGWALINNSEPVGPSSWFQGNETIFSSHEGAPDAYIAANFESTADAGDISNWLITPEVTVVNGTEVCFWTRKSPLFEEFLDRLEVRMSVAGESTDVGDTAESVGDFTELLLTIEPDLELPNEYPDQDWEEFCLTVRERSREPVTGRFAFRYWVTDSGPDGSNGDYIGIDTVSVTQPDEPPGCDNPVDIPWLMADPTSGTTPPGASDPVTVTVNAADLEIGEFAAQLCVTTNDPNTPPFVVPVSLTVTEDGEPPVIDVDPESLESTLPEGDMETQPLTISNLGDGTLDWQVTETSELTGRILRPSGTVTTPVTRAKGEVRGLARAAERGATASHPFPVGGGEIVITHSSSMDIEAGNGVACANSGPPQTTVDNQFLRTFTLEDFDITSDFEVTEVVFGVETLTTDVTVAVNLYTLEGPFTYDNLTPIGSATVDLTPQEASLVTAAVSGTAPAGSTLVVEIEVPTLLGQGVYFPGSNSQGETAPSYIASDTCDLPDPASYADIGFPNVHLVMSVTGTSGPPDCTLPTWLTVDPTSGSLPGGASQIADVTFDTTDLAPDTYQANLCLASNDPVTPLVVVPLTLTVEALAPVADISPTSFEFVVSQGGSDSDTLNIGNIGTADLVWDITTDAPDGFARGGSGSVDTFDFDGPFDIDNWTLVNDPPDVGGSFSTEPGPPIELFLTGGDAGVAGNTDFQIEVPASGTITFDWGYQSDDTGNFDIGGYVVNGVFTPLANNDTQVPFFEESAAVEVEAGDVFAFRVNTEDGVFGAGIFGATNFEFMQALCDDFTEVPWLSADPTSGTTAPGASEPVDVLIDSTGLDPGDFEAALCVATNDPNAPVVPVPVSLTVKGKGDGPIADITPEKLDIEVPEGGGGSATLNVGNIGFADLTWTLDEAEPAGLVGSIPFRAPVGYARASGVEVPGGPADRVVRPAGQPQALGELDEGFDDITTLPGAGWAMINNSEPLGVTGWFQGNPVSFPSHEGAPEAYIGANFNNASGLGTISNWLLTPELDLDNGTELTFWTRAPAGSTFPDRLEVRLSTAGGSTDVGETAESVGDFTELLLTINENLEQGGYPETWTEFVVTVSGLDAPTTGRLAFRYWVTDSGPNGSNGDYIGIDTLTVTQPGGGGGCASPVDIPWLSAKPLSGTTAPGASEPVDVAVDATGLEPGEYEALLCVTTNDPNAPLVVIPVNLTVLPGQELACFEAKLSGDQEVPPVDTDHMGAGAFTYDFDTMELTWEVSHDIDLVEVVASHIHVGAIGENGPIEIPLDHTMNPIVGSATLTQEQEDTLTGELFYVNVHTNEFPGGEIRGQILPCEGSGSEG